MSKKEIIWRDILAQFRLKKKIIFTQKELAANLGVSLSTVFNALKTPREANIIRASARNFRLDSYQKLLLLWASHRSFKKDIIYKARVDFGSKALEAALPPSVRFGLYSAFVFAYHNAPADYDHVYVYADPKYIPEIEERLSSFFLDKKSDNPNFFVLNTDQWLARFDEMPPEQIFVDIWNAPEWYAKDFLKRLEEKLPLLHE